MPRKINLAFLILCGIWSQVIIETFANENINSSSILDRQKRVINHLPDEDRAVRISDHPYIVNIKLHNRIFCVGTILSQFVVITTAECGQFHLNEYDIVSSSSRSNRGTHHIVRGIRRHYSNHPNRTSDGIALLTIHPPIVFNTYSKKIDLHTGPLLPGMIGTVSGWGYNDDSGVDRGTKCPSRLRSIQVPIMAHRECVNIYRPFYQIADNDICTFHDQKYCGHSDAGAPLVINDLLVGIFLRRGPTGHYFNNEYPDVFALLQHIDYKRWLLANI